MIVKSRRRAASCDGQAGSPSTAMPRWPGRPSSRAAAAPRRRRPGARDARDLKTPKAWPTASTRPNREHALEPLERQPEDLDVVVLHGQAEERVAHRAADEIGPSSGGAQRVQQIAAGRRELELMGRGRLAGTGALGASTLEPTRARGSRGVSARRAPGAPPRAGCRRSERPRPSDRLGNVGVPSAGQFQLTAPRPTCLSAASSRWRGPTGSSSSDRRRGATWGRTAISTSSS